MSPRVVLEFTICNESGSCDVEPCENKIPSWTSGMLGVTGNCSHRNILVSIINADSSNPNTQFIIKRKSK